MSPAEAARRQAVYAASRRAWRVAIALELPQSAAGAEEAAGGPEEGASALLPLGLVAEPPAPVRVPPVLANEP
jgi:hypothetical protein